VIARLQQVDKVYANGLVALRGLDLDVGEGEFLSILGPSGCGKSTVLRLVAGLGEVSGGRIEWPRRRRPRRARAG
jgi:NitT/TauT family transport system ATP-binding protein